jgi:hypothetical protein
MLVQSGKRQGQRGERMIQRAKQERRLYPRVDTVLPVKIAADGYAFASTTQNVSCVGAYCHLARYIPPFTRIAVKLTLPISRKDKVENSSVECSGVIVRTEDDAQGGFNIAIFFNEIKNTQRQKISHYISQFLPK